MSMGKQREWNEIVVEIFKRANTEGLEDNSNPLVDYFNIDDDDRKSDILSDIQDVLNNEIISEWKKMKKSSSTLADDSANLELELKNDGVIFKFKVKDKAHINRGRTFNISERSKGFQWFFNYMIKLKFNPSYKKRLENCLFLLDEPGSYLHSTAQSELLKELKRVSKKNTTIFCTHSQYLLNPNVINLGSIKIADKKGSEISLTDFGKYKEKRDRGALSPVYQALQLNFAHDFVGSVVLTEGVTDYFFFRMIQDYSDSIEDEINFIPGAGASQSFSLLSFAISFSDNFYLFLDRDSAGEKARKDYINAFGDSLEDSIHFYSDGVDDFVLEDFLCDADKVKLKEFSGTEDLKRAMGFLYYGDDGDKLDFVKGLSRETKNRLTKTLNVISDIRCVSAAEHLP